MMQGFTLLALAVPFSCLLGPILGADTFVPDHVLRVTARNITLGCASRYSLLVNGTYPGPELRLKPIGAQWIRVFNDMIDTNLSMVRHLGRLKYPMENHPDIRFSMTVALARPASAHGAIF